MDTSIKKQWRQFYNKGSRRILLGNANYIDTNSEYIILDYQDLNDEQCE